MNRTRLAVLIAFLLTVVGCASSGPQDAFGNTPTYHVIDLGPRSPLLRTWTPRPFEGTPFEKIHGKNDPLVVEGLPDSFFDALELLVGSSFGGPLPPASGIARDIDEQGRVAGHALQALSPLTTRNVPALYSKNQVFHLDAPSSGVAMGMNNNLQLVGAYNDTDGLNQAFVWHGRFGQFESLPQVPNQSRVATAIADDGTIVGFSSTPNGFKPFKMVDGELQELATTFNRTFANDVNDDGLIVGRERQAGKNTAVKWEDGAISPLNGTTDGDGKLVDSVANAVNDKGLIAGRLGTRAVVWTPYGVVLDVAGGSFPAEARDVNTLGQVVGTVTTWRDYAFIYPSAGSEALELLIDQSLPWVFHQAVAINDKGWITGNGDLAGESRVFLLVPWGELYSPGGTGPIVGVVP